MRNWRSRQRDLMASLLKSKGITGNELARGLDVNRMTVSRWREGLTIAPWYAIYYLQKLKRKLKGKL